MKKYQIFRLCAAAGLWFGLAACTAEKQEECLPCQGVKKVAVKVAQAPAAGELVYPLYMFRRPAGTEEAYRFDRSFASVTDGTQLRLPLAELTAYEYRFLMLALPADNAWLAMRTANGTPVGTDTAWDDVRLAATETVTGDGYCGVQDMAGSAILSEGTVQLVLTRVAGQMLFDFYRIGTSISDPQGVVSSGVESVLDRVSKIEVTYTGTTTELRFDAENHLVPAATAADPSVQTIEPELTDFKLALPQAGKGLLPYDESLRGSVRMEGLYLLPSDANVRVRMTLTYFDTTPVCGNGHTDAHKAECYTPSQLTLDLPAVSASSGLPVEADCFTVNRAGIRTDRVIDVPAAGAVEATFGWE